MMNRACTGTRKLIARNGWIIRYNLFAPRKQDGTVDRRHSPTPGRTEIHRHENGRVRIYRDNLLRAERPSTLAKA